MPWPVLVSNVVNHNKRMWLWIIPTVVAARYLLPLNRGGTGSSKGKKSVPPAIQFNNPYNPSLDDHLGIPMELSNKEYVGKIVPAKPPSLSGPPPNYDRQFVNVDRVPYSSPVIRMKLNQQAYRMSNRQMARQWDPPAPRIYNKVVIRTDHQLSTKDAGDATPIPVPKKRITKVVRKNLI